MTGLYECLVQIRALHHTARRLTELVAEAAAGGGGVVALDLLRRRTELEVAQSEWLHLLLGSPAATPKSTAADLAATVEATVDRFLAARDANLTVLERLGAVELERTGRLPDGRPATVTDVVAMMMTADTDSVAAFRTAAASPPAPFQGDP